jgi:endonuclease/exonuclease/phosphatase family metal-dependent hydrolase
MKLRLGVFFVNAMLSSVMAGNCNRPEISNGDIFPVEKDSCESVRIISYNIRGESLLDREQGNSWDTRKYKIQYLMQCYQPDIIGLQEVSSSYIPDLLNLFAEYTCIAFDTSKADKDVALLVRTSRFIVEKQYYFWLSQEQCAQENLPQASWDNRKKRIVVYAVLHDLQTDKSFVVFCTHFDSRGAESHIKSAQLLIQQQRQIAQGQPVVIMGDFNLIVTHPTRPDIIKITEDTYELLVHNAALQDIRDFNCTHYGPDGSWIGWQYDKHAAPLGKVGERLDHMFVGQCHVKREGVLNVKVNDSLKSLILPSGQNDIDLVYPSDHLPIVADLVVQ